MYFFSFNILRIKQEKSFITQSIWEGAYYQINTK